jgi:anthranilate synthase component 2
LPPSIKDHKSPINNESSIKDHQSTMILVLDNRDSFVYNLARYVRELGGEVVIRRSDEMALGEVEALGPTHIVISPGPCTPAEAGISTEVVRRFGPTTPILGVCLGHQCIGAAYGGEVVRAGYPMHGKTSFITHHGTGIFSGLPSPLRVARYHSLVIAATTMPASLRVLATADDDGEVMAVAHSEHPVIGVQFHPESAATEHGYAIVERFLHGEHASIDELPAHADGADEAGEVFLPWTPSEDMRWRPFVPPPGG